jgi:hypothetical protein
MGSKTEKRWNELLKVSTLYSGDDFAIEIPRPSVTELRGRIRLFRNRKGFCAQAFYERLLKFSNIVVLIKGIVNY